MVLASLSERPIIAIVSSLPSWEVIVFLLNCVTCAKEIIDVLDDGKNRARRVKTPRSFAPLASTNLGTKSVPVTVIPRLGSANPHNPSQQIL